MATLCNQQSQISQTIVDAGGLNAVFRVLGDPRHCIARTDGIVAVVNILSGWAEDELLCKKLIQRGAAAAVAPLLFYSFVATNASRVFFNMSRHRIHRSKLLEVGVHEALMELGEERTFAEKDGTHVEPAFW